MAETELYDKLIAILKELIIYIVLGLLFFIVVSFPAFFHSSPNTSVPEIRSPPTRASPTFSPVPVQPVSLGFLNGLFMVLGFIGVLAIILLVLLAARKVRFERTPREKVPTLREKVKRLKFSRDEAIRILKEALETGKYQEGIIDAFHVLDAQLENFRKIARPKHWTPKEYAIGVTDPVFKPSAYILVQIFYRVQYGQMSATREDVLRSLDALQSLFIDENPPEKRERMSSWFEEEIASIRQWEIIPRTGDLLKPKPRKGGKK
ncbi:MAG: DUF4129 domain-containing protein [Methanobacteriota archaeon]|nr:MAG: DUF4129 domain-containing protein [Euryarchaeota archaeon]